jgi:hypothetical protein
MEPEAKRVHLGGGNRGKGSLALQVEPREHMWGERPASTSAVVHKVCAISAQRSVFAYEPPSKFRLAVSLPVRKPQKKLRAALSNIFSTIQ